MEQTQEDSRTEKPTIAARQPAILTLEPGTYYWCRCENSKSQPFCNGSHKGIDFVPMEFVMTEQKEVALCQCKHTKTPPFCDGTHKTL